jgi:Tol biopolymer transport system component
VIAHRRLTCHALGALLACLVAAAPPGAAAHRTKDGPIAFSHAVDGGAQDILSIHADGGDARRLTRLAPGLGAELPAWDPGGRRVYFDSDLAGGILPHVFAVDALGHQLRQITRGDAAEVGPRISPDGRLIALERENATFTTGGVYVARKRGTSLGPLSQLTAAPTLSAGGFDAPGDFSPDGSRLAFLRVLSTTAPNARSAVFVIGLDGRGLTQVTPYELNASLPRWSPDATRLLFSSNWDNHSPDRSANVYSVRPDGSDLTQITHERHNRHAFTPDWAPHGTRIVYAYAAPDLQDHTELHVRNLAGGRERIIWRGEPGSHSQDPDWGPPTAHDATHSPSDPLDRTGRANTRRGATRP